MPYELRNLRPLTPAEPAAPHSLRHVRFDGGTSVDVIQLDHDVYVHSSGKHDAIGSGAGAAAYVAHRVGDPAAVFCVRRFGSEPNSDPELDRENARADCRAHARLDADPDEPPMVMFTVAGGRWGTVENLAACSVEFVMPGGDGVAAKDLAVLLLQVAQDLRRVHAAGMAHNDIKALNVLVETSPRRRLRLIDLNLASLAAHQVGKPARYGITLAAHGRPPECGPDHFSVPIDQGRSATEVMAADVYALAYMVIERIGAVLKHVHPPPRSLVPVFEQLRRGLPVTDPGDVPPALLERMHSRFAKVRSLPHELSTLLLEMLAVAPEDRPTIAEVVERLQPSELVADPESTIWFEAARGKLQNLRYRRDRLQAQIGALQSARSDWLSGTKATAEQCHQSRAAAHALLFPSEPQATASPEAIATKKKTMPDRRRAVTCWTTVQSEARRLIARVRHAFPKAAAATMRSPPTSLALPPDTPSDPSAPPSRGAGTLWAPQHDGAGHSVCTARGLSGRESRASGAPGSDNVMEDVPAGLPRSQNAGAAPSRWPEFAESTLDLPAWWGAGASSLGARTWMRAAVQGDETERKHAVIARSLRALRSSVGLATPAGAAFASSPGARRAAPLSAATMAQRRRYGPLPTEIEVDMAVDGAAACPSNPEEAHTSAAGRVYFRAQRPL